MGHELPTSQIESTASQPTERNRTFSNDWMTKAKPIAKWLIIGIVAVFLVLTVRKAYLDLETHREHLDFSRMDYRWLALGVLTCALGMFPAAIAWLRTLQAFGQSVPTVYGLYAYFLGHLGKYVPGKAMVIVLRVGKLHAAGVEIKPSVVSIFVETFTSLGVGAIVGALFLFSQSPPWWMQLAVILCIPIACAFLLPHTFRSILAILSKSRIGRMPNSVKNAFTWKFMLQTCGWMTIGWLMQGTAGWWILCGLSPNDALWTWSAWAACVSAIALASVIGFASMLPGGAVVRELVITWLLSQIVPQPIALFSAVAFRIANLIAEFSLFGLLSLLNKKTKS